VADPWLARGDPAWFQFIAEFVLAQLEALEGNANKR
jgi:hypothetical protein